MVQDFTDLPSRSTVQAPQWLVSQPICGPVRFSCSRRKWISSVRGSTSPSTSCPLTFMVTWVLAILRSPLSSGRRGLRRRRAPASASAPAIFVRYSTGPRPSAAGEVIASAAATARFTVAASRLDPTRILAASAAKSGVSATLVRPIAAACHLAAGERENHRRRRGGVVADLALQLLVGLAMAGRRAPECGCAARISPGSSAVK